MKRQRKIQKARANKETHKYFTVKVNLLDTDEKFVLKKVHNDMTIRQLKEYAEFITGVPYNLQRLTYLDEGDLLEHTDIRHNDIIAGAHLTMRVWHTWKSLVEAAATNDAEWLFQLGVTLDSSYNTPNSEFMSANSKRDWIADRAATALYIAAHRGNMKLCLKLIEAGANVNGITNLGRTALHVAAARGHGEIVDMLLDQGANINAADRNGDTALTVASQFGHKGCERHLFLFRWQERAQTVKPNVEHEMFAHQYFDSAFPVWFKGKHGQVYYTNILPPGEYEGTRFSAPRKNTPILPPESPQEDLAQSRLSGTISEEDQATLDFMRSLEKQRESTQLGALKKTGVRKMDMTMTPIAEHSDSSRRGSSKKDTTYLLHKSGQHRGPKLPPLDRNDTMKSEKGSQENKHEKSKHTIRRKPESQSQDKTAVINVTEKSTDKKGTSKPAIINLPKDDRKDPALVRDWFQHHDKKWTAYEMWQKRNEIDLIEEIRAGNIPISMKTY